MIPDTVAAAALAHVIGVSPRSITDLAKRGIVVRDGRGFNLSKSVRGYCQHLRTLATGRGGDATIATPTAERARLARAQADLAEVKSARLRGALLDAGAVEAEWSGVLRTVRAGMLAVPSRAAQRLPHLTTHVVAEIDAEVRSVLAEMGQANAL